MCKACDGVGLCNQMPSDDDACGTIECNGLNTSCTTYQDLTANRCLSVGACKMDNTSAACTMFTSTCAPDAGADGGKSDGSIGIDGGGKGGGGGGGCGCALGGSQSAGGLTALLALAGVIITRRRRR